MSTTEKKIRHLPKADPVNLDALGMKIVTAKVVEAFSGAFFKYSTLSCIIQTLSLDVCTKRRKILKMAGSINFADMDEDMQQELVLTTLRMFGLPETPETYPSRSRLRRQLALAMGLDKYELSGVEGNVIMAIKAYREWTGLGLKDAKAHVDVVRHSDETLTLPDGVTADMARDAGFSVVLT